jgi:predicted nucleotidyltransferase
MDLLPRLQSAAADVFAREGVQFAYLFGSQARGQAREGSDVDIAVHFSDDVPPAEYLSRSFILAGRLAHRARVGPIEGLVVLNEAPLRLVGRILRDRVVLYTQNEPARVAFETRLGKLAMDFEILAAPLDRALLAAMAHDGDRS